MSPEDASCIVILDQMSEENGTGHHMNWKWLKLCATCVSLIASTGYMCNDSGPITITSYSRDPTLPCRLVIARRDIPSLVG